MSSASGRAPLPPPERGTPVCRVSPYDPDRPMLSHSTLHDYGRSRQVRQAPSWLDCLPLRSWWVSKARNHRCDPCPSSTRTKSPMDPGYSERSWIRSYDDQTPSPPFWFYRPRHGRRGPLGLDPPPESLHGESRYLVTLQRPQRGDRCPCGRNKTQ